MTTGPRRILSLAILMLHAGLCFFLISEYGILGAASSLFIAYFMTEFLRLLLVKHFFGIFPLDFKILKPAAISVVLYGYLSIVDFSVELNSAPGLFLAIICGISFYTLSFFVIAQRDERNILLRKLGVKSRKMKVDLDEK